MSWNRNKRIIGAMAICSSNETTKQSNAGKETDNNDLTLDQIKEMEKGGKVNSIRLPDTWANREETGDELGTNYKLQHFDPNMTSAEKVAKFVAEKKDATGFKVEQLHHDDYVFVHDMEYPLFVESEDVIALS